MPLAPGSSRVIRRAPSRSSPSQAGSSAAAVSALTTISSAVARSSSSKTRVAAGPQTSSSRCGTSVRKKWHAPEWTPADIRSSNGPTELTALPTSSIVHCMSDAAPQARSRVALAAEEEEQRVAAELEHVAAVPFGDPDQLVEDRRDLADELLGAGLAVGGETLRECGEAGDVDRDERAVERARARAVGLLAPSRASSRGT